VTKLLLNAVLVALMCVATLHAADSDFSGSLDCSFLKNQKEEISLIASRGDDYEEESTEYYNGDKDDVHAEVLFLPFQYGIVLSLNHKRVEKTSEGVNKATVILNVKKDIYTLSCTNMESYN
jgi:hypothetical protein